MRQVWRQAVWVTRYDLEEFFSIENAAVPGKIRCKCIVVGVGVDTDEDNVLGGVLSCELEESLL